MPEIFDDRKVFTLAEVTRSIQRTIAERYTTAFWVKAEMNKLNHYSHSGHCYPDLVEKKDGRVIAQLRASLWKDDYRRINKKFLEVLREPLKDGINILFSATIGFDPMHGLSLRIIDIDPVFSLGELEREKQESIAKLTQGGIFDQNKKTKLALLPKRIAVISVETSKGYSDYLNILDKNPWGYRFFNVLFPSLLQGEKAVTSILQQLRRIKKVIHHFDAVAIIRGGGGEVGLSAFNHYDLAQEVAQFPIPVFTGIGHSTNETVVEMVSFKNAITPSELADFLIQKFHDFAAPVHRAEEFISESALRLIRDEKSKLENTLRYFQSITHNRILRNRHFLDATCKTLQQETKFQLKTEREKLAHCLTELRMLPKAMLGHQQALVQEQGDELNAASASLIRSAGQALTLLEKNVGMLDPINILRRGFTITVDASGKAVKDPKNLLPDDLIKTIFADGEVVSRVENGNQESHE
jgi:exodeoxyribonuclease VII large subunit